MQDGPADQAELADFIARGNKPDLVALLRHAGERLPSGSDTTADHRVVLLQYLKGSEDCGSMDHKRSQLAKPDGKLDRRSNCHKSSRLCHNTRAASL